MDALTPGGAGELKVLLAHTFELVLLLGYAVVHPWLHLTGAFTGEAARRLESMSRAVTLSPVSADVPPGRNS